jgi:hypothetical protein
MRRSLAALALLAIAMGSHAAFAQAPINQTPLGQPPAQPPQCNAFVGLKDDAEKKALAVRAALEHKAERKDICTLVVRFAAAEETVIQFLEKNKTWCGIPDQAITGAKTNHEHTLKFRTAACTEAPASKPRPPSLSDAIGTSPVDTGNNTKTGRGTLDSLNGNPLAK